MLKIISCLTFGVSSTVGVKETKIELKISHGINKFFNIIKLQHYYNHFLKKIMNYHESIAEFHMH